MAEERETVLSTMAEESDEQHGRKLRKRTREETPPVKVAEERETVMAEEIEKQYWLLKTEPGDWSWQDQLDAAEHGGASKWDGVKNKQAQKNLKSMRIGDLCFFYHSGAKSRQVVGVVSVAREWYSGDGDGDVTVDVEPVGAMRRPVDLAELKREGEGAMKGFALLRQPRLSVVPVPAMVWARIRELGGGFDGDGSVADDQDGNDD